jgi:hypothetical protein
MSNRISNRYLCRRGRIVGVDVLIKESVVNATSTHAAPGLLGLDSIRSGEEHT